MKKLLRLAVPVLCATMAAGPSRGQGPAPPPGPAPSKASGQASEPAPPGKKAPPAESAPAWKPEISAALGKKMDKLVLAAGASGKTKQAVIADFDGDGRPDVYTAKECSLARHLAAGWALESVNNTSSQPENTECLAPLRIGGQLIVPITGGGHETDSGKSYTWEEAGLYYTPPGQPLTEAWALRVEENVRAELAKWRFTALGKDSLLIASNLGDERPAEVKGALFQTVRFEPAQNRFSLSSCWQRQEPKQEPTGKAVCTGRLATSIHLRNVAIASKKNAPSELPAGSAVEVLSVTSVTRGTARLYCVRTSDRQLGYAFLLPTELSACPDSLPTAE